MRRALRSGWIISAIFSDTRITESHRKKRHLRFIVKCRTVQPQPIAQTFAAGVIPRDASLMNFASWRLADDQKSSAACQLYDGMRRKWQLRFADPTSGDFAQYAIQRHLGRSPR
jgi:hypothetical protein